MVAGEEPRGGAGAGVAGLGGWRIGEEDADGEVGEGRDGDGEGVRDVFGAGGDGDAGLAGEEDWVVGVGGEGGAGRAGGEGEVDAGDVEGLGAEGVGEANAYCCAAGGEMDDLAEGGVGELGWREGVVGLGDLLAGGPGGEPEGRLGGGRFCYPTHRKGREEWGTGRRWEEAEEKGDGE